MKNLEYAIRSYPEENHREEWSIEFYDQEALSRGEIVKGKPVINCRNPPDVQKMQALFPELINKDTDVFHTYQGVKIKHLGSLEEVKKDYQLNDDKDLEEVIEITDEDIIESRDDPQVIDLARWKGYHQKTKLEPEIYQQIFTQHQELGLSIDYFVRKNNSGKERKDHRYRMKKKAGVAGGWVSREYVVESVNALMDYRELVEEDDLESLRTAMDLAEKYFTKEAGLEAKTKISDRIEEKLKMVNISRTTLDPAYLIDSYDHLLKRGEWEDLKKAEQLSKQYFTDEASKEVFSHLSEKAVELGKGFVQGELLLPNTAKQVFSYLIRGGNPYQLSLAENIAQMYLPAHIAAKVGEKRQELLASLNQLTERRITENEVTKKLRIGSPLSRMVA
ncbi:MAG: hypothetical protein ABIA37_03740 [Candidatus Woesearchaeota archaeon]